MKLLKIFSNFGKSQVETKPVLNKIENIFKNSNPQTLESHNYRTLIDTDFHPEDIFKDLDKTTSSIPNQSLNDKNKYIYFLLELLYLFLLMNSFAMLLFLILILVW